MNYRGDIKLGDTIDIKFTTVNTSGVPTTLAGSPVVSAYVDNGTTEITAGITLTVDFDSRTGMHNVRVVASSGNGFAAATNVDLAITTGTVSGNSVVGYIVGSFSIEDRPVNVDRYGGTAGTFSAGRPEVNTTHAAGTAWGSGAITAASIAADAITAAKIAADAIGASELAADAVTEIADGILARDIGSGSGAGTLNERTVRAALRFLRNKWDVAAGTLTVTKEDDTTSAWTSAISSNASADPIIGSDPA